MSSTPVAQEEVFGKLPDGREVRIFTLTNDRGLRAKVTEYGAILVAMEAPDRAGMSADLTHGFDTLAGWLHNPAYLGATIGRFGNRIRGGRFSLDGRHYTLATNNAPGGIPCTLHGGLRGFDQVLWTGKALPNNVVEFSYQSPAGEEGFPGNLDVKVTYQLTENDELIWRAEATTDAPTLVNLVHHSYWNLSGDPASSAADHELMLTAEHYLPTDAGMIPTGEIASVAGTPMDFTRSTVIGARADEPFEPLTLAGGYDHCWVLPAGEGVRLAARLHDPKSGRTMEIATDQPGIQFYAGNSLDGTLCGKNGVRYARRSAVCLETERFPDAPNHSNFPSAVLRRGEIYQHVLVHKFSVQ